MMGEPAISIVEHEKRQEWWWAAEKKRSSRLDYLRKAIWKKGAIGGLYPQGLYVDLERPVLQTEKARELESSPDPYVIKFAKILAHVLDNKTIFITDHSQLVGYLGSLPNTITWDPTLAAVLNHEVVNDPTCIQEPLEESLKIISEVADYWAGKSDLDKIMPYLDLDDAMKVLSGAIGWGVPLSRGGYSGKDYEYIMTGVHAFEDIIEELDRRIDEADEKAHEPGASKEISDLYDKMNMWEAMKIALEAGIRYAKRYARLARIIAENYETDDERKEELLQIAEVCEHVPAKPPRTLQESLQYDLFIQLFSRNEAIEGAWPARPDYYHGPYYEKQVNVDKTLTKEEALDLAGEFLIRAAEVSQYKVKWAREGLQGIEGTWVWTLGGVKKDGSDACNGMTIALLQASRLVRVANPTFAFRWHPKVSDEVMREVFECIRQGLGYPSIRNDPVLIANAMNWHGHPIEEARTWAHQACMSPAPCTKHGFQPMRMANATVNCAKIIEYVFSSGFDNVVNMQIGAETPDAATFTEYNQVFDAWVTQMKTVFSILVRPVNRARILAPKMTPRPFLSAISERSIESGLDVCDPSISRGNAWITAFTWVENADSLAAIKKLVFDEKKYTMAELKEALANDWQGYEEMRLDFVKNAPKWGNDDDYVDTIMLDCLHEAAKFSRELKCPSGNSWPILPENVSGNIHYANIVGALPNGRRLGDALYDGGISPGPGLDKKGPTAVLKSCSKIDHISDGRAFLLNQRLSPTQLAGEKGYQLWKTYMKTWADLGLDHVQFNCVSDEILRNAQKDPEKYQEVIVRVAGYSAHFVDISRKTQDNIIQRTVQGLG
ncbi:MAG: formate acetyltransferase [Deltaproteobacteria bacterium]|nr:formate acetyltransferase [Deltaproteobacteria bacterium]MBN2845772.1 formate acetyltransferase [Deltaproteobacteria bacterium]